MGRLLGLTMQLAPHTFRTAPRSVPSRSQVRLAVCPVCGPLGGSIPLTSTLTCSPPSLSPVVGSAGAPLRRKRRPASSGVPPLPPAVPRHAALTTPARACSLPLRSMAKHRSRVGPHRAATLPTDRRIQLLLVARYCFVDEMLSKMPGYGRRVPRSKWPVLLCITCTEHLAVSTHTCRGS